MKIKLLKSSPYMGLKSVNFPAIVEAINIGDGKFLVSSITLESIGADKDSFLPGSEIVWVDGINCEIASEF